MSRYRLAVIRSLTTSSPENVTCFIGHFMSEGETLGSKSPPFFCSKKSPIRSDAFRLRPKIGGIYARSCYKGTYELTKYLAS